ncbi:hypothetical protein P152DRAFT_514122 [Eremomyces bilateralis CBS 781.70]|uniref:Uncharacterized protein n=1 Tax=Eremomyces bilateralis CBS 781.70 TaxID=1392243 RepID=A0A6G1G391_9PEZI|nr:uncharacterized protein P152DRAFT_514122 [Eremomyces bilateralis CBS 781.70]KAF1812478.1 hypothetical protein P152DRAFT_514122 [Eremomyces bilateralis CBS 781.70]
MSLDATLRPLKGDLRPLLGGSDGLKSRSQSPRSSPLYHRPPSSLLRRRSWASFSEQNHRLFDNKMSLVDTGKDAQVLALPMSNPSFDMAYFLKNTGPPTKPGPEPKTQQKRAASPKTGLRLFRTNKHSPRTRVRRESIARIPADGLFIPHDGVVQKVSQDGNKYLQIIPNTQGFDQRLVDSNNFKYNLAAPTTSLFSSTTEEADIDGFDSWLSTLEMQQAQFSGSTLRATDEHGHENTEPGEQGAQSRGEYVDVCTSPGGSTGVMLSDDRNSSVPTPSQSFVSANTDNQSLMESHSLPRSSGSKEAEMNRDSLKHKISASHLVERQNGERLAGQGLRRPSRDQASSRASEDGTVSTIEPPLRDGQEPLYQVDATHESASRCELFRDDSRSASNRQTRKNREEKIRARKLRDLRRVRDSIDSVMARPLDLTNKTDAATESIKIPEKSPKRLGLCLGLPFENKPRCPGYHDASMTPDSIGGLAFTTGHDSSVLAIAEKATVVPARSLSTSKAPHITASGVEIAGPRPYCLAPSRVDTPRPGATSPINTLSSSRNRPSQKHISSPINALTHPSAHSHHPSPSDPTQPGACASIGTESPPRSLKGSILDGEKDTKIERLERENRLLEAALMAVLRTAGRLNGCPCGSDNDGRAGGVQVKKALEAYLETRRWTDFSA